MTGRGCRAHGVPALASLNRFPSNQPSGVSALSRRASYCAVANSLPIVPLGLDQIKEFGDFVGVEGEVAAGDDGAVRVHHVHRGFELPIPLA